MKYVLYIKLENKIFLTVDLPVHGHECTTWAKRQNQCTSQRCSHPHLAGFKSYVAWGPENKPFQNIHLHISTRQLEIFKIRLFEWIVSLT